ncbi:uncharacterized protein OCT59_014126 [Rhizophagus irregularis]|uniref:Uncharacterized protein n=4 Tax=Rhizophagus irregularis TaxID=588596 RepID=A0A015JNL6_RHIIW|nr:hypothetical protein RirG_081290 [Rhizophagus irregularis DAOM 197198w]UZO21739.1 hypothetical protein OCT59_014126 [Rhizophagus irregularis]CAB4467002.1 unnamed protein product [Rhizophagus irregularis]
MKYYRVPAGTGPPEVGEKYTILHWPLHRINALSQGPLKGEYKLDENNVKFYQTTKDGFVVPGCSSFVPLNSRHNVPSRRLLGPESPCYFLSPGTVLPDGLAIVYTKKMKTRFPSDLQHLWHFNIFPTRSMTLHEYSNMIKNLDWKPCNIKVGASPDKLVSKNDDIDGLKSIEILGLYFLMSLWYDQATNSMDRLQANEIHTWISLDKPTFQDLICDEDRSFYVFSMLDQLKTESVTLETYCADILGELEDRFMWKESDFFDPKNYLI